MQASDTYANDFFVLQLFGNSFNSFLLAEVFLKVVNLENLLCTNSKDGPNSSLSQVHTINHPA